ncbi:hypothetical protein B0H19DRAFT_952230, partial [Mycena capillaripes]
ERAGPAPFTDLDGSPVYGGSAIVTFRDPRDGGNINFVQPTKITPHPIPTCTYIEYGADSKHFGRYEVLVIDGRSMEWIQTSHGRIPEGRTPIEGGYVGSNRKLYHATARVEGILIPGIAGPGLPGCYVSFGGKEHAIQDNYEVLYVAFFSLRIHPLMNCIGAGSLTPLE